MTETANPAAWRPEVWSQRVPLSKARIQELISDGSIRSVKIGRARLIVESPEEWLARCAVEPVPAGVTA